MKDFLKLIKVDFMQGVEEPWCNNQGVAILPYVLKENDYYYLLVQENNPLFKNKQISKYSTITGGIENNNPEQTVINEMWEETGIDVSNKDVVINFLGKHYANNRIIIIVLLWVLVPLFFWVINFTVVSIIHILLPKMIDGKSLANMVGSLGFTDSKNHNHWNYDNGYPDWNHYNLFLGAAGTWFTMTIFFLLGG